MYFVFEFDLIDIKELSVLEDVIIAVLGKSYESKFTKKK